MTLIKDTPLLNISVLHSFANQCYNLGNENKYSLIHQSPLLRVMGDFCWCGYMSPIFIAFT